MDSSKEILTKWLNETVQTILTDYDRAKGKYNSPTRASGRFAKEIRFEVEGEIELHGFIEAPFYAQMLQDGRRPTPPNAPRSNPTLQQAILKWIGDKGIVPGKGTREGLSWAISKKIHQKGYTQRWDILSNVNTNLLLQQLSKVYVAQFREALWRLQA